MAESLEIQVARIQEQVKSLDKKVDTNTTNILAEIKSLNDNFANRLGKAEMQVEDLIRTKATTVDFNNFQNFMAVELSKKADESDVTLQRRIVYGAVAIILIAFLSAIIGFVVVKPNVSICSTQIDCNK